MVVYIAEKIVLRVRHRSLAMAEQGKRSAITAISNSVLVLTRDSGLWQLFFLHVDQFTHCMFTHGVNA